LYAALDMRADEEIQQMSDEKEENKSLYALQN
jgi:hypothetical protein